MIPITLHSLCVIREMGGIAFLMNGKKIPWYHLQCTHYDLTPLSHTCVISKFSKEANKMTIVLQSKFGVLNSKQIIIR